MKSRKAIMALAMMATAGTMVNAYGNELTTMIQEAQATVTYHVDSEYCVQIPDIVVADGTNYALKATMMDLCGDEHVEVSINGLDESGGIQMYSESGKWMYAKVYSNFGEVKSGSVIARFYDKMMESVESFYILPELNEGAGNYSGGITFNISLVKNE